MFRKGSKIIGWYYVLFGGSLVFMMVGIVIVGLLGGNDFFEVVPRETSLFALFFFSIGISCGGRLGKGEWAEGVALLCKVVAEGW